MLTWSIYLPAWNTFSLIISCFHINLTVLFQKMFENTYSCYMSTRLIIKAQLKEIWKNTFFLSLIFVRMNIRGNISWDVIFSLKFSIFLKVIVLIFLLSLKFSEQFLLLLPPGLNFGDNKLLLPKYETFTLKCLLDVQSIASCNSKGFLILYYKKVGKRKYYLQLHCLFHSKRQ